MPQVWVGVVGFTDAHLRIHQPLQIGFTYFSTCMLFHKVKKKKPAFSPPPWASQSAGPSGHSLSGRWLASVGGTQGEQPGPEAAGLAPSPPRRPWARERGALPSPLPRGCPPAPVPSLPHRRRTAFSGQFRRVVPEHLVAAAARLARLGLFLMEGTCYDASTPVP